MRVGLPAGVEPLAAPVVLGSSVSSVSSVSSAGLTGPARLLPRCRFVEEEPGEALAEIMFVRFISRVRHGRSESWPGIFAASPRPGEVEHPGVRARYAELADWFNREIPIPGCFGQQGGYRGVCWFRASAREPIQRCWEMVALLRELDLIFEMLKTDNPGTVIYRDRWQVVAKPYPWHQARCR